MKDGQPVAFSKLSDQELRNAEGNGVISLKEKEHQIIEIHCLILLCSKVSNICFNARHPSQPVWASISIIVLAMRRTKQPTNESTHQATH